MFVMDLSSTPIKNPGVLAREIFDGGMVLVNSDNAGSLALSNQTAVVVWEMADGKNTVQDIIKGVKHQFQGVPDTVSSDIFAFLELLARDGFVGFEVTTQVYRL